MNSKIKSKAFFADQGMHESLEDIISRVQPLERMFEDISRIEEKEGLKRLKETYKGYLSASDFEFIKRSQDQIKFMDERGSNYDNFEKQYINKVLQKVLPEKEMKLLVRDLNKIFTRMENDMFTFIEEELIPELFVDRRGNDLDYNIIHSYEVRCDNCKEITSYNQDMGLVIREKDFLRMFSDEEADSDCENRKCRNNPDDTFLVSAANNFRVLKALDSNYANEIGARMKAGGRLASKLVDSIADMKPEGSIISDVAAIRIIASDEENAIEVKNKLSEIIHKYGGNLQGKIDYRNFPRKKISSKPVHSGIHTDLIIPPNHLMGNNYYIGFEIQIQDQLGVTQDIKSQSLSHTRYIEKQEAKRKDRWRPIHYLLESHLKPLFSRADYLQKADHNN